MVGLTTLRAHTRIHAPSPPSSSRLPLVAVLPGVSYSCTPVLYTRHTYCVCVCNGLAYNRLVMCHLGFVKCVELCFMSFFTCFVLLLFSYSFR